ncbi:MAG: hypothetical protein ABIK39_04575 [candidate division WOR-3 bacterium]
MQENKEKGAVHQILAHPLLSVLIIVVLLLILAGGVVVVIKNARRVQVQPAPGLLVPTPVDTTMQRSKQQLRRGISRLEKRLAEVRQQVKKLTPYQDSLFQECTKGLSEVWEEFAKLESAPTYLERKELMKSTRKRYVELRELANQFVISVDSLAASAKLDSLDQEFRRLVGE